MAAASRADLGDCRGGLWSTWSIRCAALNDIVVILAGEMGCGDPGCNNAESNIETPNIDRTASEGWRFTGAHSAASWCAPTLYGLLTTLLDASRELERSR